MTVAKLRTRAEGVTSTCFFPLEPRNHDDTMDGMIIILIICLLATLIIYFRLIPPSTLALKNDFSTK